MRGTIIIFALALLVSGVIATGIGSCQVIVSPGPYQLTSDLTGAPFTAFPQTGTACIRINVSNVVLDCAGHTILNNGTGGTTNGIITNQSLTNITIRNCPGVANYTTGIRLDYSDHSVINNCTTYNDSFAGIYVDGGTRNNVTNSVSYDINPDSGGAGFYLNINSYILFVNDSESGSYDGFLFTSATNATIQYCNVTNNSNSGFDISASSGNLVQHNNIVNASQYGVAVYSSSNGNAVDDNTFINNSNYGIYLGSGSNNTFATNDISGGNGIGDGIYVLSDPSSSGNHFAYGSVHDNTGHGLAITAYNDNFTGITIYNNGQDGIFLTGYGNGLKDMKTSESGQYDFYVSAPTDAFCNNSVVNMNGSPYYDKPIYYSSTQVNYNNLDASEVVLCNASGSHLTNVTVSSFYSKFSTDDYYDNNALLLVLSDNVSVKNSDSSHNYVGFQIVGGTNDTISNCTAINDSQYGFYIYSGTKNTLSNDTADNSGSSGFQVSQSSTSNTIANDEASGNVQYGFAADTSSGYNNFANDTAIDNINRGFSAYGSSHINFTNDFASGSGVGFYLFTSSNNVFLNDTATMDTSQGFYLINSNNDSLVNNLVYDNSQYGFDLSNSVSDNFTNNSVHGVSNSAIYLAFNSNNNILANNTFYGNSYGVISATVNNTQLIGGRFYNNTHDLRVSGDGESVNLSKVIFDNPAGDFNNFTNLSLNHTITSSEVFSLTWSQSPAAPPPGYSSFAGKIIAISDSGSQSLGTAVWSWRSDEVNLFDNESTFGLYGYNGSAWVNTGASLDTVGHTLTLSGYNSSAIYDFGIFENQSLTASVSSCAVITSPGPYLQTANLAGAPYDVYSGNYVCVLIMSSNVDFDCDNYNTSGFGVSHTSGFWINGTYSNVTIRNCNVYYYGAYGIIAQNATGGVITGNTVFSNGFGIVSFGASGLEIANNTAYGQTVGIYITGSNHTLANNTAYSDLAGLYLASTNDALLANNTAFNNSVAGLYLNVANRTSVINDHYYNNTPDINVFNSSGQSYTINLSGVIIDNPAGNFANYTNISLNDTVGGTESYALSWATNTTALPAHQISFLQKYVNITNLTAAASIDSVVWSWSNAEASNFTPAKFRIMKYDSGGWSDTGAALNTGSDTLSISNLVPSSIYGILENTAVTVNLSSCAHITSSGTYYLNQSVGGGSPAYPTNGAHGPLACILIDADYVTFDCNGYSITGGTNIYNLDYVNGAGVVIQGNDTIVQNCPGINNYSVGIQQDYEDWSGWPIVVPKYQKDNSIINNTVYNCGSGVITSYSTNATVYNNTIHDYNNHGISESFSEFGNITGNVIVNNTNYFAGIYEQQLNYTVTDDNDVYDTVTVIFLAPDGIEVDGVQWSNFTNNSVHDLPAYSFLLQPYGTDGTSYNNFVNNNVYGIFNNGGWSPSPLAAIYLNGQFVGGVSSNNFTGNSVHDNAARGVEIDAYSDGSAFSDDHFYNNSNDLQLDNTNGGGTPYSYSLSNDVFDSPGGSYSNYTNLSLSDSVTSGSSYFLNWSAQPASLPFVYSSVGQKFINITRTTGTVSIDSINWTWSEVDETFRNESNFLLFNYYGGVWSNTGATFDEDDNILSLSGISPSGVYGIVENITSEFAPTQGTPILNSTYGTNLSSENLTVYNQSTYDPTGLRVTNIIGWNVNGNPIETLNMPFDTNVSNTEPNEVRDYSALGDSGTLGNWGGAPPVWVPNCISGGCYQFSGNTNYIDMGYSNAIIHQSEPFTISFWGYLNDFSTGYIQHALSLKTDLTSLGSGENFEVAFSNLGDDCGVWIGDYAYHTNTPHYTYGFATMSTMGPSNCNASSLLGAWKHIAVTYNGQGRTTPNNFAIYVNGVQQTNLDYNAFDQYTYDNRNVIGGTFSGGSTTAAYGWNGMIDEVRVYNRALSSQEIQVLSQNRTDVMASRELHGNDVWQACITPNDGVTDGQIACSNNLTVIAAPGCSVINTSGTYLMNVSYVGAPNPGYPGRPDCVDINASNVVFDCNGNSITNNGTSLATGIFVDSISTPRTNVTVQNCPDISGYTFGIWALNTSSSVFTNLTVHDISDTAIFVGSWWDSTLGGAGNSVLNSSISSSFFGVSYQYSPEGVISGNQVSNITAQEIFAYFSDGTSITGNTLYGPALFGGPGGIEVSYGEGLIVANNSVTDMGTQGIFVYTGTNDIIVNNSVVGAPGTIGFDAEGGVSGNNFTGNTFDGNNTANVGFYIDGETTDTFTNDTAVNALIDGFDVEQGSGNVLTYDVASNNGQDGFMVHQSDYNLLSFNNATNNGIDGFLIDESTGGGESYNTLTNNLADNNHVNGIELYQADHALLDSNNATNNGNDGFLVNESIGGFVPPGSSYNNLTDNLAFNNLKYGIELDTADHDLLGGNLVLNNSLAGIFVGNSATSTIFDNTVDNTGVTGGEYVASDQYFSYGGTLYDFASGGTGTYFVENLNTGPCAVITGTSGSISSCEGFDGTTDLSVALTSFNPSVHSTIIVNQDLNSCSDFYSAGGPGTCAFTCVLYTPNGPGHSYTLNNSCLSSITVGSGLPDPPYVDFASNSLGIELSSSSGTLVYNNIFNASTPAIDDSGTLNSWNTVQQAGPNIIGGADIGGNYYPDYTGVDTDGDGLGETPYAIKDLSGAVSNHDELPLTNTPGGMLCNASILFPPGDISALQNTTFNVTSTVECCGNITCQGVQAAASYLYNGSANVTYDYADGRANAALADNEYFGAHLSACKNESVGQGFDNCVTPATAGNITALGTPDPGAAVLTHPSSFQESFASAKEDPGRIGYYAFTRFVFDVSNYSLGSNAPAYFRWRGYTGTCRVSVFDSWERNDGYLLYGRNSSGDYVLLADDSSKINTRSLNDNVTYISDIDQYINASGMAEFVVEAPYQTWSGGVNGACGGSAVETDYVALKISTPALQTAAISTSPSATPFSSLSENPANSVCMESMEPGTYCNATWTINATGTPISTWSLLAAYTGTNVDPLDTGTFNVTITKPELCNASIIMPPGNISVPPGALFNITSTIACCGTSPCGDVEAQLSNPAVLNLSFSGSYDYADGKGHLAYAHSESPYAPSYPPSGPSTLSECKSTSIGTGFDSCGQLENATATSYIATIDDVQTNQSPGPFLEALSSNNYSSGYYTFTRFVFNVSDYTPGIGASASFRWRGYTGTCRSDRGYLDTNAGDYIFIRNSMGGYESIDSDTPALGYGNDLTDKVLSISDIDSYVDSTNHTVEFVVQAVLPTGSHGPITNCGGSTVETDYVQLNITGAGMVNLTVPLSTNPLAVPFFTNDQNPRLADDSCLHDLAAGASCNTSWTVDASGVVGNSSLFYVLYNQQLQTDDINVTIAGEAVPPNVTLISPTDGNVSSRRMTTFNCSAIGNVSLASITLYDNFTGSWQANQTNMVGGMENSTTFTLNLPYAHYSWNCLATDTSANSAFAPANFSLSVDSLPIYSDFFGGSTTDFLSELDLTNVSMPILENTTYGKIQWNNNGIDVAGADFNSNVLIGRGWASVNSGSLDSSLNTSANITLYNLPFQYTPVVYVNGVLGLLDQDYSNPSYNSHIFTFSVPHFTNYSTGPNTNLSIYSQYEMGSVSKLMPITFYANYTNVTNGNYIPGATCIIAFDDATSGTMVDTGSIYNFTKLTGFATTGVHLWNVTCSETGYETLTAYDSVMIGVLNLTGNQTSLYMANVTNATALPRFEYNESGNVTTEGGNITGSNVYTEQLTDRWAAFYGNISGSIILTNRNGMNNVYSWGWTPANGGVVCTSTNSSVTDLTLYPADGDDIDAAWSFAPTESDSGRNTFNHTGCNMTIGITPIDNSGYVDTGQPGGFITCSLKDKIIAAKPDMYFCTNIEQNGEFWNGQTGNFELMVPTAFGVNQYETYYFYVNLN